MLAYEIEWNDESKTYIATCPSLPGCMSDGETIAEAQRNIEQAAAEWIEEAKTLRKIWPS